MSEVCEHTLNLSQSKVDSVKLVELINQGIHFYQNLVEVSTEYPVVLGMFLGSVLSTYLRRFLLRSAARLKQK
jgi:hypothetical protein